MSETQNERRLTQNRYEIATRVLSEQFSYGLTPTEAVDYLAVEKADIPTGKWADTRGVAHSTVSGNVSRANTKINESRLNADVTEDEAHVTVHVTTTDDEQVDIPLAKTAEPYSSEITADLQLVYEAMGAIHGYYADEHGNEFESTLWFDGRRTNSFEEFDFANEWGTPEAKADTILWRNSSN